MRSPCRSVSCFFTAIACFFLLTTCSALGQTTDLAPVLPPCVQTAQILELAEYLSMTPGTPDSYERVTKAVFDAPPGTGMLITAFEEDTSFIYAQAELQSTGKGTSNTDDRPKHLRWVRRLIVLGPSTFIVDNEFLTPVPAGADGGCISSTVEPQIARRKARSGDAEGEVLSEILFPDGAEYHLGQTPHGPNPARYIMGTGEMNGPAKRLLQILYVGAAENEVPRPELDTSTDYWKLSVMAEGLVYRLTLPSSGDGAGEIAIATLDGKGIVSNRPLPSGILPHGPSGNRLMEHWDSAYRKGAPAPWDIGRPADELKQAITKGKVRRCRALDMCCGSGTDAIFLAQQGFDVTGIDISPTALAQAAQKAHDANVSVRWVLADVLAPPDLQPFDFLYDRACYHVVRKQNLKAYIASVQRLSYPGTSFLLLAARPDDLVTEQQWGVTEEELRLDFHPMFNIESLQEAWLETTQSSIRLPAWSVFLKRKPAP